MTLRRSLVLLASALFVALPVLMLYWLQLRTHDQLREIEAKVRPIIVEAEPTTIDSRRGVQVSVEWEDPMRALAPPWDGTVTRVPNRDADAQTYEIRSGDIVITIDGIDRLASASTIPYWRALSLNASGPDVANLQQLLAIAGIYDADVDGEYGPATARAVEALEEELGVPEPDETFDPELIVWLPVEPFIVERLEAELGHPAPAEGADLLVGPPKVSDVTLLDLNGTAIRLEGSWLLEVDDDTYSIENDEMTAESLEQLAVEVDPEVSEVSGRVRLAEPVSAVEVPATAITSNEEGQLCVWVPRAEGYSARVVSTEGGRVASVFVTDGLHPRDAILLNPADILQETTCP